MMPAKVRQKPLHVQTYKTKTKGFFMSFIPHTHKADCLTFELGGNPISKYSDHPFSARQDATDEVA